MRVLITGIAGFAGSHLAEMAVAQGAEVFGSVRSLRRTWNLSTVMDDVTLIECDLRDRDGFRRLLATARPDRIFHLASETFPLSSWRTPAEVVQVNVTGQINLLEAVRALELDPIIHLAGSSEEYGLVFEAECPVRETNTLRPLSPAALGKVAKDLLGYQYFVAYGLRIVRTRAFYHTGPRQGELFVLPNVAQQMIAIERGLQSPTLRVGNLGARLDVLDVRDVVRAYWTVSEKGTPGEVYNVASGRAHSMRDIVTMLLAEANHAQNVEITSAGERMRPEDLPLLVGDSSKLRDETGWAPRIPLTQTLWDLLEHWRTRMPEAVA